MAGRILATENSRVALTISSSSGRAKKFPQYLAAILGESIASAQLRQQKCLSYFSKSIPKCQLTLQDLVLPVKLAVAQLLRIYCDEFPGYSIDNKVFPVGQVQTACV
jgi:hypothetical protein